MVVDRWDPFSELRRMEDTVNRLWRGYGIRPQWNGTENWGIPLDVVEEDDHIIVRASLPGVDPENIQVNVENDMLTIKAETKIETEHEEEGYLMRERRVGSFHRSLRLPDSVDQTKATAKYENGVLTLTFPKSESKKPKRLKVEVVDSAKVIELDKK
jgi:HSP20 family protein